MKDPIRILDDVFSQYIRLKAADDRGFCTCVTCGHEDFWKQFDAGHYIPRRHMATRWDERNVGPQCIYCNRGKGGMFEMFEYHLVEQFGEGILDELQTLSKQSVEFYKDDLLTKIIHYKDELRKLKKIKVFERLF